MYRCLKVGRLLRIAGAVALLTLGNAVNAQTLPHKVPNQHFLVIGVAERPGDTRSLAVNSANELVRTLKIFNRTSRTQQSIVELIDAPGRKENWSSPTSQRICDEVDKAIGRLGSHDEFWVYFCGHSLVLDEETYLVPSGQDLESLRRDSEANRVDRDALISVKWLYDRLEEAGIRQGVIIIDSCRNPLNRQLGHAADFTFKPNGRVALLTSCSAGQFSLLWPSRQCALYTYWLNQGLAGAADLNLNGHVTLYEISEFVEQRVTKSVPIVREELCAAANYSEGELNENHFAQTPQYIGDPAVETGGVHLAATNFGQAMDVLARHTHDLIMLESLGWTDAHNVELSGSNLDRHPEHEGQRHESDRPRVAVGEFLELQNGSVKLRGPNGLLGKIATDRLVRELDRVSQGVPYVVLKPDEISRHLLDVGVSMRKPPHGWRDSNANYYLTTVFAQDSAQKSIRMESRLYRSSSQEEELADDVEVGRLVSYVTINREISLVLGTVTSNVDDEELFPVGAPDQLEARLDPDSGEREATPNHPFHRSPWLEIEVEARRGETELDEFEAVTELPRDSGSPRVFLVHRGEQLRLKLTNSSEQKFAVVPIIDGISVIGKEAGLTPEECVRRSLYFTIEAGQTGTVSKWMVRSGEASNKQIGRFTTSQFVVGEPPQSVSRQLAYGQDLAEIRVVIYPVRSRRRSDARSGSPLIGEGRERNEEIHQDTKDVADVSGGAQVIVFKYIDAAEHVGGTVRTP